MYAETLLAGSLILDRKSHLRESIIYLLIYLVFYWRRAKFEVEIHKEKLMASPLVQHGLEISIKVWVTWD